MSRTGDGPRDGKEFDPAMEPSTEILVGREDEQAELAAFVAAPQGGALILRGDTGAGKSALLDDVTRRAADADHTVARATGVEAEAGLAFAGLHQLLHSLVPATGGIAAATRAVIDAAFGRPDTETPSVMSLGIAILDLLSCCSADRPVLLVVDDGQWFDEASIDVCGFVGRRLTARRVRLLIAVRTDIRSRFDESALPELSVPPLSHDASTVLLDRHHPHLPAATRRAVLEQARGNPLAVLELPAVVGGLAESDRLGSADPELPLPRRLQSLFRSRIAALDPGVRAQLLRGALDGVGARSGAETGPVQRYRMRDVDAAVDVGLLEIDSAGGDLRFRHPLVRAAVVRMATANQRRAAHAALAEVHRDDLERRAAHLSAAAVDPDEGSAAVLEAAAASATRRGGASAAVAWLTRAAELSEHSADRSRRLRDAAFVAGHAARLAQAQQIADLDPAHRADESAAAVLAAGYRALYHHGDVRSTHRRLTAAILRSDRETADEELSRMLTLLLAVSQYHADPETWTATRRLIDALGDRVDERCVLYADTWSDVVAHGAGAGARLEIELAAPARLDPWDVARLSVSAYHLDRLGDYRAHLQSTVDRELDTGAVSTGLVMLQLIMLDQIAVGEWAQAEQTGAQAIRKSTEVGHDLFTYQVYAYLAQLAALRGDSDRTRELAARVEDWALPRTVGFLVQAARAARVTAACGEGRYDTAYDMATGITPAGSFAAYTYQASRTLLDLVEAALASGRADAARAHALAAADAGLARLSPRLAILTYGALAMTTDDDREAADLIDSIENHPAAGRFPFDQARIRFAYGSRPGWAPGDPVAQCYLSAAAETFARLGSPSWAERARGALQASRRTGEPVGDHLLTAQERRIAELAAEGLTNKEIGAQLYLSPRTVSSHLYRIFPKLGIGTRAALRDALTAQQRVPHG
ncbi:putative transcriptional regulator, LuxR family [Nocardia nova SH22a]|uniref:Putative transcriptional regulator, LuxR family n=1 Tax=Nocardia nova SH22a TaxID=1415166 RepID=W5TBF4_9NOCA|nr:LuxR family transcriptional regulator [Nocardia nova]AHH16303.1 putative transcriptional regulator, LuxR family [Nocardia nova SH22a]